MSLVGIIPPLVTPTVDPCSLTLGIGPSTPASLQNLRGLLANASSNLQNSVAASVSNAEATVLNALNVPALSGLLSSVEGLVAALQTPIPMGITISTPGVSVFAGIVQQIVGSIINNAINSLEQQVINQAESLAAQAIDQAISSLANAVAEELRKDLSPVIQVINTLNGIVGQIEATKALVGSVLDTASSCPAKAEIMAEAFFNQ